VAALKQELRQVLEPYRHRLLRQLVPSFVVVDFDLTGLVVSDQAGTYEGADFGYMGEAHGVAKRAPSPPMTRSLVSLTRLRRLHRIGMRGRQIHMTRRVGELLTAIEFEYARFQEREDKRMYLEIGDSYWRSHR